MESKQLNALIVDSSQELAQALLQALQPEIQFTENEFTSSLRKAALSHAEATFHVCFVSETFADADLASFFEDMKRLERENSCVFVQVREAFEDADAPPHTTPEGFDAAISRRGSHNDRDVLNRAIRSRFAAQEKTRRALSVDEMMQMVLKEIDRTATDRRRGVERKLIAIPMDGIELETQFDSEVLESYLESLSRRTQEAAPRTVDRLAIPDDVLRRALPNLTKDGYRGASHRVWELLAQKYGVPIGEMPIPQAAEKASDDPSGVNVEPEPVEPKEGVAPSNQPDTEREG